MLRVELHHTDVSAAAPAGFVAWTVLACDGCGRETERIYDDSDHAKLSVHAKAIVDGWTDHLEGNTRQTFCPDCWREKLEGGDGG